MNYLAHCYLSGKNEDLLLGNFMTDFLQKKEERNYKDIVLLGIQLHRAIDTFTDQHPATLDYSDTPLPEFNAKMYEILLRRRKELPAKLNARIQHMVESDFLMAYSNKDRMRRSLQWMDKRVNFESAFHSAVEDVKENEEYFEQLFSKFFPELVDHSMLFTQL